MDTKKLIIGCMDRIDLPKFGLYDLPCKIDTGADSSAIHCHKIRLFTKNDIPMIGFHLLDPEHPAYNGVEFKTKFFKEKLIKNSFGQTQNRYVITVKVLIFGELISTKFTLADRENMQYPILLGKRFLKNRFLVDVSEEYLSYNKKIGLK